jgi:hypothetical protein
MLPALARVALGSTTRTAAATQTARARAARIAAQNKERATQIENARRRRDATRARDIARTETNTKNNVGAQSEDAPQSIGIITIFFLVSVALFFDGIQGTVGTLANLTGILMPLGVGLNFFITILAQCTFFIWFLILGRLMVKDGKGAVSRLLIFISELIVEITPVLNAVPAITSAVVSFIILCAIEDKARTGASTVGLGARLLMKTGTAKNASALSRVGTDNLQKLQAGSAGERSLYWGKEFNEEGRSLTSGEVTETGDPIDLRLGLNPPRQSPASRGPEDRLGYAHYGVVDQNNNLVPGKSIKISYYVSEGSPRSRGFEFVEPISSNRPGILNYRFVRRGMVHMPYGSIKDAPISQQ